MAEYIDLKDAATKAALEMSKTLKDYSDAVFAQQAHGIVTRMQLDVSEAIRTMTGGESSKHDIPIDLALLHSEVSEALEEWRYGRIDPKLLSMGSVDKGKPLGLGAELADVLIRLLDLSQRHGYNLFEQYNRVMNYNKTRNWKAEGKNT